MFVLPAGRPARHAEYLNPAQRVTQIPLGLMGRGIVGGAWHGISSAFNESWPRVRVWFHITEAANVIYLFDIH